MVDDLYREDVMDHYKNPRHYGSMDDADVVVEEKNASCGDEIKLSLKLKKQRSKSTMKDKNAKLEIGEVRFEGVGCAVSMAFASMLLEKVEDEGLGLEEIRRKSEEDLLEMIGGNEVSVARQKCVRMGVKALRGAVEKALRR